MRSSSTKLDTSAIQRSCLLLVFAATVLIAGTELNASTTSAKPNIVILLADDLGWNDVGYHGSEIKTPHIDRLAREGLELDRFYVAPYCCPTRAGLMTGRYPHRFGYRYISKLFGNSSLPQRAQTLAEMLGTVGYRRRACIGKWHLSGRRNGRHPLDQGFDHFYGLLGGMVDYFSHKTVPFVGNATPVLDWHRNNELNHDEGYSTDLLADESVRFIENSRPDEPFFLYVAFNAPHLPLQAKPEHLNRSAEEVKLTRILFTGDNKVNRQILSAMVTSLDDNIGRILAAIDKRGLRQNTLVLFHSDNGGQIEHGASDNSPLRGSKNSVWEGGVRVPAAVRWPAVLEGGRKIIEPMSYIDVFPTLGRIVGSSDGSAKNTDGVDVLDLLTGKQRELNRYIYLGPGTIVNRQWKLVEGKLFQIDSDPGETTDVAEDYHDIAERLREKIRLVEAHGSP